MACGPAPEEQGTAKNVNQVWSIKAEDNFKAEEKTRMQDVCNALQAKTTFFMGNYADQSSKLITLVLGESEGCGESEIKTRESKVGVRLVASDLYFNGDTHFPEVITKGTSELKDFCGGDFTTQENSQRYVQSGSQTTWYYVLPGTDVNCSPATLAGRENMVCFMRFQGSLIEGRQNQYKINEVELIRVKTPGSGNGRGIVQFHELASSCAADKTFTKQQTNNFFN